MSWRDGVGMTDSDRQSRAVPWMSLAFMLFVLLLLGGVVALSYSPLIDHLFRTVHAEPVTPAPSGQTPGAPAPDNVITQPPSGFPGPDNTVTSPQPSQADPRP